MLAMDTQTRTCGLATYEVEVSGSWFDPRTAQEAPRSERFSVLALAPAHAEYAGLQLFGSAAADAHCVALSDASARVGAV
jgi:hypothetical protein